MCLLCRHVCVVYRCDPVVDRESRGRNASGVTRRSHDERRGYGLLSPQKSHERHRLARADARQASCPKRRPGRPYFASGRASRSPRSQAPVCAETKPVATDCFLFLIGSGAHDCLGDASIVPIAGCQGDCFATCPITRTGVTARSQSRLALSTPAHPFGDGARANKTCSTTSRSIAARVVQLLSRLHRHRSDQSVVGGSCGEQPPRRECPLGD